MRKAVFISLALLAFAGTFCLNSATNSFKVTVPIPDGTFTILVSKAQDNFKDFPWDKFSYQNEFQGGPHFESEKCHALFSAHAEKKWLGGTKFNINEVMVHVPGSKDRPNLFWKEDKLEFTNTWNSCHPGEGRICPDPIKPDQGTEVYRLANQVKDACLRHLLRHDELNLDWGRLVTNLDKEMRKAAGVR